jgi:peptidoglycan/xylan/chitin deacetylase (PgdA/CDA1 family)
MHPFTGMGIEMLYTLLWIILAALGFYLVIPILAVRFIRWRFNRQAASKPLTCLTFDDGPEPASTPRILAALKRAGIRATFFFVGEKMRQYPELVDAVRVEGHEIGFHGFSHRHAWKTGPIRSVTDILAANRLLKYHHMRPGTILFRPPYGKLNGITLLSTFLSARKLVFWNRDPKDYQSTCGAKLAEELLADIGPGQVILLHEGRRDDSGSSPAVTAELVEHLTGAPLNNSFRFATMSEFFREEVTLSRYREQGAYL